jgi:hypothetical protein
MDGRNYATMARAPSDEKAKAIAEKMDAAGALHIVILPGDGRVIRYSNETKAEPLLPPGGLALAASAVHVMTQAEATQLNQQKLDSEEAFEDAVACAQAADALIQVVRFISQETAEERFAVLVVVKSVFVPDAIDDDTLMVDVAGSSEYKDALEALKRRAALILTRVLGLMGVDFEHDPASRKTAPLARVQSLSIMNAVGHGTISINAWHLEESSASDNYFFPVYIDKDAEPTYFLEVLPRIVTAMYSSEAPGFPVRLDPTDAGPYLTTGSKPVPDEEAIRNAVMKIAGTKEKHPILFRRLFVVFPRSA